MFDTPFAASPGSYSPVIKLIFAEDRALDPSTLTAIRTVLSALVLMAAVAWQLLFVEGNKGVQVHESQATGQVAKPTPSPDSEGLDFGILRKDPTREGPLAFYWTGVLPAGIELGLYNFAGTAAQAMGLQLTSATRAAFLVQLTGLLVPMLSYLAVSACSL